MQLLESLKKKAKGMGGSTRKGGNKHVVTVLQADGRVLEFRRPILVSDLLNEYPNHFVCHSSALVLMQHGKMLPGDAILSRGEVYFLLPLPRKPQPAPVTPLQPIENTKPAGTMKFVMTRQQLAMLLAEGNVKIATKDPKPLPPPPVHSVLHHPVPSHSMKRTASWTPGLDSISEVPVM